MKPIHEQEWTDFNTHAQVCRVNDGKLHPVARVVPDASVRRFISAAPDMARALLSCREHLCCSGGCACDVCSALRKAGVIPTQLPAAPDDNQA